MPSGKSYRNNTLFNDFLSAGAADLKGVAEMRASYCEKCKYHTSRTWSPVFKPQNSSAADITHRYGFCMYYWRKCSKVKFCNVPEEMKTDGSEWNTGKFEELGLKN